VTRFHLLLRNLLHFRGVNIAVIVGMAVATAVLSGAMMVGDSVRGSLRELALQRLGNIDYAMISTRFFDASLANHIAASTPDFDISPTAIVSGAASDETNGTHTADVQIAAGAWIDVDPGKCIINGDLADSLGIKSPGESIVLSVPTDSDAPREAALDRRSRTDTISGLRAEVSQIVRDPGVASMFNPNGGQRATRNAWVNLDDLQDALDQTGRVNALLAHARSGNSDSAGAKSLNDALPHVVTLADYGLTRTAVPGDASTGASFPSPGTPGEGQGGGPIGESRSNTLEHSQSIPPPPQPSPGVPGEGAGSEPKTSTEVPQVAIGSRLTYLAPPVVAAADAVTAKLGVPLQKISVNLLTSAKGSASQRVIHYAVVAGVSELDGQTLGPKEVAVNQWTADQLAIKVGDTLTIDFYQRGQTGELLDASASHSLSDLTFTVSRILPMTGIGADPSLPPDYKGLTDADSVADWDPPEGIKIDKSLVTKADEAYWHSYRAAPKIFVNFDTARRLWGGVYGDVTGLRVPADKADAFCDALRSEIPPQSMQMIFRPIKAEQLAAASGGTDFSQYFLYFSFFLIVAAVLLVAMLFRLGIEQRARQLGLLSAVGFAPGQIRRLAIWEGVILAVIGGVVGSLGGIGYTWLIMAGLRTWWIGAVGTTALRLYVRPDTLVYGFIAGVIVAKLAVWWGAWRIGRAPVARLLAGSWENETGRSRRSGRILRILGVICVACGLAALAAAAIERKSADEAFLAGGSLLLCGSLVWLAGALRPRISLVSRDAKPSDFSRTDMLPQDSSAPGEENAPLRVAANRGYATGAASTPKTHKPHHATLTTLPSLGIRNATRHTARSVLAIGLIAFAVFTLIVVAVMRQSSTAPGDEKQSGTGGYRLILQAAIPIYGDLNTVEGRKLAGMHDPTDPLWSTLQFTPMRRWAGQDISCLNLMRPTAPTILSVPGSMVQRNAFTFASKIAPADNPWTLLTSDQGDAIPVIADDDTAQYILNVPLGGELTITDQLGRSRQLRLVATIAHSIFQSELLMGEANFQKLFPATNGAGVMLIDCQPQDQTALRQRLSAELDEYSVSVDTTAQRLATYEAVANTYLATFQTLGSLGLLLGTVGLAVVLIRTVLERKPELALLACLGFGPADRVRLVLCENGFLLLMGLAVGTVCALIGVLPAIVASGRSTNLTGLGLTLLAVMVVGLVCSSLAVAISGIHVSPADLRRE
jgi:putative ABC transport system permease protein